MSKSFTINITPTDSEVKPNLSADDARNAVFLTAILGVIQARRTILPHLQAILDKGVAETPAEITAQRLATLFSQSMLGILDASRPALAFGFLSGMMAGVDAKDVPNVQGK